MNNIIELTQSEVEIIFDLIHNINESPSANAELFCQQSKEVAQRLPQRIKDILFQFGKRGSDTGFLLIRGIDLENEILPDTPSNNNKKIGEQTKLAKIQSLFIHIVGEMIAYEAECYGRLFQDVVPTKSMENDQTSLGSNKVLEIHTEQAFSKLRPDILSLSCLRGDPKAFTYVLPVKYIVDNISEEERELLKQPLWTTEVDLSFKLNGHEFMEGDIRGPLPILNGQDDDPILIFDQDLMTGITEAAENMIKKIVDIYNTHRLEHNIKPGEIILIDNRRAVHGRSAFFPKYDGRDRFLIRCFSVMDYNASKYARLNDQRMVFAIYS